MTPYQGPKGAAFDPVAAVPLSVPETSADDAPIKEDVEKGYSTGDSKMQKKSVEGRFMEAEGSRRGSAQSGGNPDRRSQSRKGKEREQGKHGKGLTEGDAGESDHCVGYNKSVRAYVRCRNGRAAQEQPVIGHASVSHCISLKEWKQKLTLFISIGLCLFLAALDMSVRNHSHEASRRIRLISFVDRRDCTTDDSGTAWSITIPIRLGRNGQFWSELTSSNLT